MFTTALCLRFTTPLSSRCFFISVIDGAVGRRGAGRGWVGDEEGSRGLCCFPGCPRGSQTGVGKLWSGGNERPKAL